MITDNGWNTDDAQDGFIYTQEIKTGRFALYILHNQRWHPIGVLSHGDTTFLVSAMQYLGTTISQRNYYKPVMKDGAPVFRYLPDDVQVLIIRPGRQAIRRYDGQDWREVATLSSEDTDIFVARYHYLYSDNTARTHYYRPKSTEETDTVDDALEAERNPDNFTGE